MPDLWQSDHDDLEDVADLPFDDPYVSPSNSRSFVDRSILSSPASGHSNEGIDQPSNIGSETADGMTELNWTAIHQDINHDVGSFWTWPAEDGFSVLGKSQEMPQQQAYESQRFADSLTYRPDPPSTTDIVPRMLFEDSMHNISTNAPDDRATKETHSALASKRKPSASAKGHLRTSEAPSGSLQNSQNTHSGKKCSTYRVDKPNLDPFRCGAHGCLKKKYGRWADFTRHYEAEHAENRVPFWCPVPNCERSEGRGGDSFKRKDKLQSHMRKDHGRQN
ncbi:hypothetical protein BKA66DRAFT_464179 [Pyrenochaeta sp. MPI-SDFR-AT-0127]|nr:hypothetical protein BKA66DRAFT_464179 [Pyrenochaeta sp. MPI-SDFR-AT-0127]